jgi:hypothetical protein
VAEGGGLLNRYTIEKSYRGFESLSLLQIFANILKPLAILFEVSVQGAPGCQVTQFFAIFELLEREWDRVFDLLLCSKVSD